MTDAAEIQAVESDDAPSAIGPYSQAVVSDGWIFCSGQIAIDPVDGSISGGITEQTHQALRNLSAVLEAAHSGLDQVVKTFVRFQSPNEEDSEYLSLPFNLSRLKPVGIDAWVQDVHLFRL